MQRVLGIVAGRGTPLGLSTPVAVSAGHGIAGHPQGVTGPSHTRLAVEERDGFMHVGLETPVQNSEVMLALTDLSSLGGSGFSRRSPPTTTTAHLPTHTALHHPPPHIEELYSESEASSDGGEANLMMASADALHPFPLQSAAAATAAAQEGDREAPLSTLDLLACTVTNMLNNDEVVGAITSHLLRDPAFVALMDASQLGLPAPARVLLLREAMEGEGSDGGENVPAAAARRDSDPLLRLLRGIQKGVAVAAMRLGEACCHLGNFLRGLGESLSAALAGLEGASTPRDPQHLITNGGRNYQTAVVKVSLAVAVLVFSRRAALGRAVMA